MQTNPIIIYTDYNSNFTTNSYQLLFNSDVVFQSIYLLLHTNNKEAMMEPTKGIGIDDLIFGLSPSGLTSSSNSKFKSILASLQKQEKRILVDMKNSSVSANPDNYELQIQIVFSMIPHNILQTYTEIIKYAS